MFSGNSIEGGGSSAVAKSRHRTALWWTSEQAQSMAFLCRQYGLYKKKKKVCFLWTHNYGFYGDDNFAFRQGFEKDIVLEKFETQKFQLAQKLVSDKVGYQK